MRFGSYHLLNMLKYNRFSLLQVINVPLDSVGNSSGILNFVNQGVNIQTDKMIYNKHVG